MYEAYFYSCTWIGNIKSIMESTHKKLEEIRPKFKKPMTDKINKMFQIYKETKLEISKFDSYSNLEEVYKIFPLAKTISAVMQELIEKSMVVNKEEEILKYNVTNFAG